MTFTTPVRDILFVLDELADLPGVLALPGFEDISRELVQAVLEENGKFVEQGEKKISEAQDYNSANTERLDVEGMKALLMKLDFIQALVAGRPAVLVD